MSEINFEPIADFLLIDPLPVKKTTGGIVLPDGTEVEAMVRGTVLKAGPGRVSEDGTLITHDINVGDEVYLYFMYGEAIPLNIKNHLYVIAKVRDVVGKSYG